MKKVLILGLFLFAIVGISGCIGKSAENVDNLGDREFRRPDFGQPDEPIDIRGLVSNIVGNEVTVLKIERSEFSGEGERLESDDEEGETGQPLSLSGTTGGHTPGMGRGGFGARSSGDADMQAQMLERMKEMASGEEKVLIPVGIRMLKPDTESDRKEPTMIEATLEDIKTNSMLQIWLDASVTDRNVARFVLVMN